MTEMTGMTTDKIRNLKNEVHLAGYLAELGEVRRGTDRNGVAYISFQGKIQCSEDKADTYSFRTYVPALKKSGEKSKLYETVDKWVEKAVPMTKNPENPTKVDLSGSIVDNPYIQKDTGKLVEAVQFNTNLFNDFKEFKKYIVLEGYVMSSHEETSGEEKIPTGRMILDLLSRDIFKNTLEIKRVYISAEKLNEIKMAGFSYDRGCTAIFNISLESRQVNGSVKSEGGWGTQYTTTSFTRNEWVLVGGEPPMYEGEHDNALPTQLMRMAFSERQASLESKKHDYEMNGGASSGNVKTSFGSNTTTQAPATQAPKTNTQRVAVEMSEEDFPF